MIESSLARSAGFGWRMLVQAGIPAWRVRSLIAVR